jgi:hypothetical protein
MLRLRFVSGEFAHTRTRLEPERMRSVSQLAATVGFEDAAAISDALRKRQAPETCVFGRRTQTYVRSKFLMRKRSKPK